MSGSALLDDLRQRGVELRVQGDRLLYRPQGTVPHELRERLRDQGEEDEVDAWPRTKLIDGMFKTFVEPGLVQPTMASAVPMAIPSHRARVHDRRMANRRRKFIVSIFISSLRFTSVIQFGFMFVRVVDTRLKLSRVALR